MINLIYIDHVNVLQHVEIEKSLNELGKLKGKSEKKVGRKKGGKMTL